MRERLKKAELDAACDDVFEGLRFRNQQETSIFGIGPTMEVFCWLQFTSNFI